MAVTIGVPRETFPGERRVALVPRACDTLGKLGVNVVVEQSAGLEAGFPDEQYATRGARSATRREVFQADVIAQVRSLGANPEAGRADLELLWPGQTVIGFGEPLTALEQDNALARAGVSFFAMELIPRITRAQSMDALSSIATISGYKAVLLAASALPKMFPMLMTAAGTMTPAKVFDAGRGGGGTSGHRHARRLGAVVSAYDVRSAVKEQIDQPGREVRDAGRGCRASEGQRRLRQSHGRDVLPPPARIDDRGDPRTRRRHHHRRRAGKASPDIWSPKRWSRPWRQDR